LVFCEKNTLFLDFCAKITYFLEDSVYFPENYWILSIFIPKTEFSEQFFLNFYGYKPTCLHKNAYNTFVHRGFQSFQAYIKPT